MSRVFEKKSVRIVLAIILIYVVAILSVSSIQGFGVLYSLLDRVPLVYASVIRDDMYYQSPEIIRKILFMDDIAPYRVETITTEDGPVIVEEYVGGIEEAKIKSEESYWENKEDRDKSIKEERQKSIENFKKYL